MTDQEDFDLVDVTTTGTKIADDSPNYQSQKEMQELENYDLNAETSASIPSDQTSLDDDESYQQELVKKSKKAKKTKKRKAEDDDEDTDAPQKSASQLAAQMDDSIQTSMPPMEGIEMISKDEKELKNGHVVQEIIMESADKDVIKVTEQTEGLSQRQAVKDVQKQLDAETDTIKEKLGDDTDVQVKTKISTNALGQVDGTVTILKTPEAIAADKDVIVNDTEVLPEQLAETHGEMNMLNFGLGHRYSRTFNNEVYGGHASPAGPIDTDTSFPSADSIETISEDNGATDSEVLSHMDVHHMNEQMNMGLGHRYSRTFNNEHYGGHASPAGPVDEDTSIESLPTNEPDVIENDAEEMAPTDVHHMNEQMNMGLGHRYSRTFNNENYGNDLTPTRLGGDDTVFGSNDIGLITRADPSTYHSAFGKHSFKSVAQGQMDDDLYTNLNQNSHYFTGIGLIFTVIVVLWIKNIAQIKNQQNSDISLRKKDKNEDSAVQGQEFKTYDDEEFDSYAQDYKENKTEQRKPYEFKNEGYGYNASTNQTF